MKKVFLLLIACFIFGQVQAQQAVEDRRSDSPLAFPEFVQAKILQPFGRYTTAKVNFFLKDGSLLFMDGKNIKKAYVGNVFTVQIGDSVTYQRIDSVFGRVIAKHGYNTLLQLTTIDMKRYESLTRGGENLPFFEIEELGLFLETNGDQHEGATGYPLKDTYYFMVKGQVYPAIEKVIKKLVKPDMQEAFKRLMNDHYWSWNDPKSLAKLFIYLPE